MRSVVIKYCLALAVVKGPSDVESCYYSAMQGSKFVLIYVYGSQIRMTYYKSLFELDADFCKRIKSVSSFNKVTLLDAGLQAMYRNYKVLNG